MEETKEQRAALDKIDELLSLRASKEDSLRTLNTALKQGLDMVGAFPRRWYVQGPDIEVIQYLNEKYGMALTYKPERWPDKNCGYGEMHGQYAFVPHDISYPWRITNEEFHAIIKTSGKKHPIIE